MLVSPAQDLPLPKDMQKALKDAQNAVTLSEAEHRRLVELRISEEMTIVELGKRKTYEEGRLNEVLAELTKTEKLLAGVKAEEASIRAEIALQRGQMEVDSKVLQDRE